LLAPLAAVADSLFVPADAYNSFVAAVQHAGISLFGVDRDTSSGYSVAGTPHLYVRRSDVLAIARAMDDDAA
ncbi:hypothetical protein OH407_24400, partial [Salmonella enterica]|uniref:hypothetical protein n=1 Tax=Salmonella enterica TaxID=28901 RepID=UPI0022B74878